MLIEYLESKESQNVWDVLVSNASLYPRARGTNSPTKWAWDLWRNMESISSRYVLVMTPLRVGR